MTATSFIDTNVLVYAFATDPRSGPAEALLAQGCTTSVQALNEFANVARRTPSEVPYWGGETYSTLATSMIPRFLWPGKPVKVLGQTFGHRYSYIHASNKSTAINLPIMVEFFVNFGSIGVLIGMAIVGFIYRLLDTLINRPGQSPLLSMIGVVILLPLLLIESDFSLVFGGLILTGFAFSIIWWQFRLLLGTR